MKKMPAILGVAAMMAAMGENANLASRDFDYFRKSEKRIRTKQNQQAGLGTPLTKKQKKERAKNKRAKVARRLNRIS